mgnify:CR=1 FL=1
MDKLDPFDRIQRWLLVHGPSCTDLAEFVRKTTDALRSYDIPIDRIFVGPLLEHPLSSGIAVSYEHETKVVQQTEISHERFALLQATTNNPMTQLVETKQSFRAHLAADEFLEMDDLKELKERGYTDLMAIPVFVSGSIRAGVTMATKTTDGFSEEHIQLFRDLAIPMGPVLALLIQRFEHLSILRTYLGSDAGERVWHGQIRRGESETLEAAICFCDLRDFTELSGHLVGQDVLTLINNVFAHLVACVAANGGQVLKFMGDGLLATFADKQGQPLCGPALNAAKDAVAAINTLRSIHYEGHDFTPKIGIGLHVGEVLYGNVGAPGRLDFTVIGTAVNQTARIEGLCARTGQQILMSHAFARKVEALDFPQGDYAVKGFEDPIRVYGLLSEASEEKQDP